MTSCWTLAAGLLLATFCTGCVTTVRMYDGPEDKPHATLLNSRTIRVVSVDDTYVGDADFPPPHVSTILIQPGVRRLAVLYFETVGNQIRFGVNRQSITYDFQAGKVYTFDASLSAAPVGESNIWKPILIDSETGKTVAEAAQ